MPDQPTARMQSWLDVTRWVALIGAALTTVVLAASVDVAKLQGFMTRKFGTAALQNYAG